MRARVDRIQAVTLVDRLAQHDRPLAGAPLEEVEEASRANESQTTPCTSARWAMVIFVCAIARSP